MRAALVKDRSAFVKPKIEIGKTTNRTPYSGVVLDNKLNCGLNFSKVAATAVGTEVKLSNIG